MIEEQIEKEAEKSYEKVAYIGNTKLLNGTNKYSYVKGFVDCAKSREKQIAELISQIEHMKCCGNCEGTCAGMFGEQRECWKHGVPTKWRLKIR